MKELSCTSGPSDDLFGGEPVTQSRHAIHLAEEPRELKAARALSARLRREPTREDKQKVAHLICLNLISMLRQGARR